MLGMVTQQLKFLLRSAALVAYPTSPQGQMRCSRLANLWHQDLRAKSCVEVEGDLNTTNNSAGVAVEVGDLTGTVVLKDFGCFHLPSCRGNGIH